MTWKSLKKNEKDASTAQVSGAEHASIDDVVKIIQSAESLSQDDHESK